jgi:hypothetical protein
VSDRCYQRRRYGHLPVVDTLARYQRSRAVDHRARVAIGAVIARCEDVRRDDLVMLVHLLKQLSQKRVVIETIEEAVRAALWIADYDARARAQARASA